MVAIGSSLTVHLHPKTIEGRFIFSHRCLVPPKNFLKENVDSIGDIRSYTIAHETRFLCISTETQFSPIFHYTFNLYHSKGLIEAHILQHDII